jgi:hypothetical protein
MLRSPLTALLFVILNTVTWGYWWMFDILQLAFMDYDELNTYGLGSPFLFEFGIAVGMWDGGELIRKRKKMITAQQIRAFSRSDPSPNPKEDAEFSKSYSKTAGVSQAAQPDESVQGGQPDQSGQPVEPVQKGGGNAPTVAVRGPVAAPAASASASASATATPDSPAKGGIPPSKPRKDDGSLKDTAANLTESILKLWLDWFLARRKDTGPRSYDWDKRISNPYIHSFLLLFFILSAPFGPIFSALGGDIWGAVMNFFNPLFFLTTITNSLYMLFFPMEIFIGGVPRPLLYTWLFTSIDEDGQSRYIQRSKVSPSTPEDAYRMFEPFINIAREGMGLAEGMLSYVPLAMGGKLGGAANKFADAALIGAKASAAPAAAGKPVQKGGFVQEGGSRDNFSVGSVSLDTMSLGTIGAVLVGGLLLGVSRSNVFQGKDDSPPIARRV